MQHLLLHPCHFPHRRKHSTRSFAQLVFRTKDIYSFIFSFHSSAPFWFSAVTSLSSVPHATVRFSSKLFWISSQYHLPNTISLRFFFNISQTFLVFPSLINYHGLFYFVVYMHPVLSSSRSVVTITQD